MRKLFQYGSTLAILLLASLRAGGQERSDLASTGNGRVGGRVVCADTQKPARFAEVRLTPIRSGGSLRGSARGAGQTSTMADGSFLIDNVSPGDYVLTARTPGYIDAQRLLTLGPNHATFEQPAARLSGMVTTVRVSGGQGSTANVTIYRGAVLAGTVTYDDGSPALGVAVSALQAEGNTQAGGGASTTSSNDRGAFRIAGLADGSYILQVRPLGSSWTKPLPVYYGNTLLKAAAKRIVVKAGEERDGLDLQVPVTNLRQVSGVVQSARDGHGIGHASISLTLTGEGEDAMNTVSLADGSFRFQSVPDGKFTLRASGSGDLTRGQGSRDAGSAAAPRNVEVIGRDVDDVVFNLPVGATGSAETGSKP